MSEGRYRHGRVRGVSPLYSTIGYDDPKPIWKYTSRLAPVHLTAATAFQGRYS